MSKSDKIELNNENVAYPFLKWAGGKSQLIEKIEEHLPIPLKQGRIKKYIEPMIGGGALFFHIAQKYNIPELFISDINEDLILCYQTIKKYPEELIKELAELQRHYHKLDDAKQSVLFYQIRNDFNKEKVEFNYKDPNNSWINRTKQIIFINRTCFNGLYRVNSSGLFNVPFGKYKNPNFVFADNIRAVSNLLQKTTITHASYDYYENIIDNNAFVYFDPPYRPLTKTSSFTTYANSNFNDDSQIKLAEYFKKLNMKSAYLMLSNSDPKNTDENDNFMDSIYRDFHIDRISAKRNINSKATKRGMINELLIRNYLN
jgi:DNA adenine methylase